MIPALAVAIAGVALGAASLGWQAATFLLTGSRLRIDERHGATDGRNIVSGPPGSQSLALLSAQGLTHEVMGAEIFNRGRIGVSVTGFRAVSSRGTRFAPIASLLGPHLPHRLEPGDSESWFFPIDLVRPDLARIAAAFGHPNPDDLAIEVDSGDGKCRRGKRKVRVRA